MANSRHYATIRLFCCRLLMPRQRNDCAMPRASDGCRCAAADMMLMLLPALKSFSRLSRLLQMFL